MLTGDLVRVSGRPGGVVAPGYVKANKPEVLDRAEEICALFAQAAEERWPRGELDGALDAVVGDERDARLVRGFAKIMLDRAEFAVESPLDPLALRLEAFALARERGPLGLAGDRFDRPDADAVLAELAAAKGVSAAEVEAALYADRPSAQRMTSCPPAKPEWLVHRYNLALVQAVLLRAQRLTVRLERPAPGRIRQILRFARFHQLLFEARQEGEALVLQVDGPLALFSQSTRYGLQLASFFPCLPLVETPWSVVAELAWGAQRARRTLQVSDADGLRSHYRDEGVWEPQAVTWLKERWEALSPEWSLEEAREPVVLPGGLVIMPDFVVARGGRRARVEVVGYWRKSWIEARIEALRAHGPGDLILVVSRRLHAAKEALADFPGEVVEFAEVIPPKRIIEAAERVAREP